MIDKDLIHAYVKLAGGQIAFSIQGLVHDVVIDRPSPPERRISFHFDDDTELDDFLCQLVLAVAAAEKVD